ncbi:SCO2522 family protein [Nocardia sp. SSK8]|uniref:SCO2522 family protein n=1 Tax=Nocardia sp. SSK8 TaxID=3120154 RepID=UPI00300AC620
MDSMFQEATAATRVESVAMSHVSLEVGHFSMDELANRPAAVRAQFQRVAPLVHAFTEIARDEFAERAGGRGRVRVSTCFLIDDYFRGTTDPREILPGFLGIAEECGIRIDYLGRESGCAVVPRRDGSGSAIDLAQVVADMVVAEPLEDYTGRRPPTSELGWLANGRRSSDDEQRAAMDLRDYVPPQELSRRNHSIFLDVEMWRREPDREDPYWSCPFLASVWQLLRLGMVRFEGRRVAEPADFRDWRTQQWPDTWALLPSVMQLHDAAPFAAFRSMSVLPKRYLGIEHSVQQILDHLDIDAGVTAVYTQRAQENRITPTDRISERLAHYFLCAD